MEEEKRIYAMMLVKSAIRRYQVGKIRFHVTSVFRGGISLEERLANLMIEDLYDEGAEKDQETE